MILEGDISQAEWRSAAFLSQDPVMLEEIAAGVDQHDYTLEHFFKHKGTRTNAKVFNFGMIYGRSEYGYMRDSSMPQFTKQRWQDIIREFFEKYNGLYRWQQGNIKLVYQQGGYLVNPTGRILRFPLVEKRDGSKGYHEPHIKNYPVQSFATGDLVPLVAYQIWRQVKFERLRAKQIQIIHDSFPYDVHPDHVLRLAEIIHYYVKRIPKTVKEFFGFEMNIPMDSEIKVGPTWGEMKVYEDHLH